MKWFLFVFLFSVSGVLEASFSKTKFYTSSAKSWRVVVGRTSVVAFGSSALFLVKPVVVSLRSGDNTQQEVESVVDGTADFVEFTYLTSVSSLPLEDEETAQLQLEARKRLPRAFEFKILKL